jgi:hypothetical protein
MLWGQMRVAAPFGARWFIDLPRIDLSSEGRVRARQRMGLHMDARGWDGTRITTEPRF